MRALVVVGALLALSCGGDDEGETLVNVVVEVTDVVSDEAVDGAEVCITMPAGYPDCVMTDATGFTTIMAPANTDVVFRVTRSDLKPGLMPFTTTDVDGTFEAEVTDPLLEQILLSFVSEEVDETKGNVLVLAAGPMGMSTVTDTTYEMSPSSGSGPWYFDDGAQPDPELTMTSSAGAAAFANVDPGTYTVTLNGFTCDLEIGFAREGNSAGIVVEAGAITVVSFEECE